MTCIRPGIPGTRFVVASLFVLASLAARGTADAQTNVALNKTATASSQESSYAPRLAVDGSTSTRWSSGFATKSATDQEWLLVDLGGACDLASLTIVWESAYAEAYQVQVSSDGAAFQTILSRTGTGGTENLALPSGIFGRYVRLFLTRKHYVWGSYWGYSIWELRVMGTLRTTSPAPTPTPTPTVPTTLLTRPLRLATWNIQHGDRDDDVRDIETQMDLLANLSADVIVLQEMHTANGDYPTLYRQGLSARTGVPWYGFYVPATGSACGGLEGNMILTWLPIVSSNSTRLMALPSAPCDVDATRGVVRVELSVNNRQVHVFGTHLVNNQPTYRAAQFSQLNTFVGQYAGDRLLGGDFNTKPEESTFWSLLVGFTDTWTDLVYNGDTGYTHHSLANTPPGKRIDYWLRNGADLLSKEIGVVQTKRSDHNPVVLDVEIR